VSLDTEALHPREIRGRDCGLVESVCARCYHVRVNRDDIRAFVNRDWAAVEDEKARYWAQRKRTMTAAEALATADTLREYARRTKPDWPDPDERATDLAVHIRVAEALRAVPKHRAR
jgi:hypothetical protein